MKKFTKILAVFLAAVLLVMASVTATVAYLTLKDINPQENVFSVGDIKITLEEEVGVEGVGSVTQSTTGADYTNIMPGDKLIKRITVANPGNNPAYVALTVKVNNIDKIAEAIDDRYAAGEIQAMYDKVFTDWGLQYNASGMSPTNVLPTDAKLLQVDAAKVDASGAPNYDVDNWFADYAANMGNNEWEFTYYLYLAPGESFTPFEGLVAPAEFDREQLAMFEGLKINAVANAIQADNTLSAKSAFAALTNRLEANTVEVGNDTEMDEALGNAVVGSTIVLVDDVTASGYAIADGKDVEIILNGNTMNGILENEGTMDVSGGAMVADYVQSTGEATFTNVDMTAGTTAHYAGISKSEDAVTEYNDVNIVSGGGGVAAADGAKVIFNSGSVAVNSTSTSGRYVFYAEGAGTELVINGGEFSFSKTLNQKRAYICAMDGTTVIVNGGNFGPASSRSGYTDGIKIDGTGKVIIKGGTFGFDPTKWVAEGYQAVQNGTTWTVTAK